MQSFRGIRNEFRMLPTQPLAWLGGRRRPCCDACWQPLCNRRGVVAGANPFTASAILPTASTASLEASSAHLSPSCPAGVGPDHRGSRRGRRRLCLPAGLLRPAGAAAGARPVAARPHRGGAAAGGGLAPCRRPACKALSSLRIAWSRRAVLQWTLLDTMIDCDTNAAGAVIAGCSRAATCCSSGSAWRTAAMASTHKRCGAPQAGHFGHRIWQCAVRMLMCS